MTPSEFARHMQRELDANNQKGDWEGWKPSVEQAISELDHHVNKLKIALKYKDGLPDKIAEFSADIGNIAMKIYETFGKP